MISQTAAKKKKRTPRTPSAPNRVDPDVFTRELLDALCAVRDGSFSARLPSNGPGLEGRVADTFNDIALGLQRFNANLARLRSRVGEEGRIHERLPVSESGGAWAERVDAINALVDDLSQPTIEMGRVIGAVAKGDLSQQMPLEVRGHPLRGEYLRTAKLVNGMVDQLGAFASEVNRVARDQALAGLRAKDEFLAALSHELRTPLSPVLLLASEAAADGALPASVRADFSRIRKGIELEARLIDDLLDLTRINSGRLALDLDVVDVVETLHDAIETVRPELEEKSITLQTDGMGKPVPVVGDAVRLQQVFWNLLSNAVKFTPALGRVSVKVHSPEKGRIAVDISDNGIGLSPVEIDRIFAVFVQGDHAAVPGVPRFGGLGLGLAICRKIAGLHSGSIRAESSGRGLGATFVLELPRAPADILQNRAEPDATTASGAGAPSGRPRRVLLVEDHAPTRQALVYLFGRRRFEVVAAATLAEARAHVLSSVFDLLVSDIGLPDGDGCELMAELRDRHGIPGIALTGYGTDGDIARSRAAGFTVHLTKPIRVQLLDGALAKIDFKPGANDPRDAT